MKAMSYHKFITTILGVGLSLIFVGCSPSNPPQAENTTNPPAVSTASKTSPADANRVVALTSLSADIIYQLDPNKLAGIAGNSLLNNDERFSNIPRVGEGRVPPSLEKIVALKPDLVIGAEGFSNQITNKLTDLNISTMLTKVDSWAGLEELTKNLATKINADPEPLLKKYQTFLPPAQTKVNENFSALVLVSNQPILSPNKSSWAGNLLEKFQVKNIAAQLQGKSPIQGYVTLSAEKVLEANPQALLVVNSPLGGRLLDTFKKETFWNQIQATQSDRIFEFDYYGLVNPGSIDSIAKACQQLQEIVAKSA